MDNSLSYEDLKKAIDLLGPKPPKVEIWVRDYIPSGCSFKVVLKDLPTTISTCLPGTEVIYMIGTEDFRSIEISEAPLDTGIPVFAPGGRRL